MYNHLSIRSGLYGLIGFKQSLITEFAVIDSDNQATSSGMYFQDYHALITIETLKNIAPEGLSDANFNVWLKDLVQGSCVKTVNKLMQKFRPKSKAIWENLRLYNYSNVIDTLYTISGNAFIGYEVKLCHSDNIMMVLNSIGLSFNADDTFNLYIFHSSKQDPIYTIEVTPEANEQVWETQTAKFLEHYTDTYSGGKFYIGYLQQDLSSVPINREWDSSSIKTYSKLINIEPVKVADHNSATLFDLNDVQYSSDTYGLNFGLTIQVNQTKQLLTQKSLLTNLIGYGVAVDILEKIANSIRDNRIKTETRDLAFAELNSENGLKSLFEKELKNVHFDFAGLEDFTMPKRNRIESGTAR